MKRILFLSALFSITILISAFLSVQSVNAEEGLILNQPIAGATSGGAKSKRGLVGQVFKPESSGVIHQAKLLLNTSGNNCRVYFAKLYTWIGDGEDSPGVARGDLLAESVHMNICSSSGYPIPIEFTWPFVEQNQIFLSDTSYYYLEIDYLGRDFPWYAPTVDWLGYDDGSSIDGKLWVTDGGVWYSPPPYATAQDLYLRIYGELNVNELEPVIIVPGIMGSRLNRVSDGEEGWPNALEMVKPGPDDYLNELVLDSSGNERENYEMDATEVIDSVFGITAYGNLVDAFINKGYVASTTLFTVPYDWRLDIRGEVNRLGTVVQEAISNSPTGKVNIIAHSMGGLLVKEYLNNLSDTSFVDKLIVAGVPQLGAPKAFKALMYGDNMGFGLGKVNILNPERVKTISQNMPGVYELLPTKRYIDINGGYVIDYRDGGSEILNYDDTVDVLSANGGNTTTIEIADGFHSQLDNKQFNAPDIYNIIGCRNPKTIGLFRIYDDKVGISPVNGDGTVPLTSAINLSDDYTNYFALYFPVISSIDHVDLIKDSAPLQLISSIINNQTIDLPYNISTSLNDCLVRYPVLPDIDSHDIIKTLYISTHSPVELNVYDSAGNHLGPNADKDIDLQIPGGAYEIIGPNNFAIIPDVDYEIVVDSPASG